MMNTTTTCYLSCSILMFLLLAFNVTDVKCQEDAFYFPFAETEDNGTQLDTFWKHLDSQPS